MLPVLIGGKKIMPTLIINLPLTVKRSPKIGSYLKQIKYIYL